MPILLTTGLRRLLVHFWLQDLNKIQRLLRNICLAEKMSFPTAVPLISAYSNSVSQGATGGAVRAWALNFNAKRG